MRLPTFRYAGPLPCDLQSARVADERPRLCASSSGESKLPIRLSTGSLIEARFAWRTSPTIRDLPAAACLVMSPHPFHI
jgi:hypothetical protein